jgi:hypothetical protein
LIPALPTPRTRHSFCPPLSLPLRRLALAPGQPVTRPVPSFAVSGNRAAATATGRATETPAPNRNPPACNARPHYLTARPPRPVPSCVLLHCTCRLTRGGPASPRQPGRFR